MEGQRSNLSTLPPSLIYTTLPKMSSQRGHGHDGHHGELGPYPTQNTEARYKHFGDINGRLGQFLGGHFEGYNLSSMMYHHRLDDSDHVSLEVWSAPGLTKPMFDEAKRQSYKPTHKGESFGPSWTNHWFKVTVRIPKEWEEYETVQLEFDPSGEGMVFTTDGDPLQGGSSSPDLR